MMKSSGFSLVELMVTVAVCLLLLAFGIPAFSKWGQKHDIETQITRLFENLQTARMKAFSEKRICGIWWNASPFTSYEVRADANDDGDILDGGTDLVVIAGTGGSQVTPSGGGSSVTFDGRGFSRIQKSFRAANNLGASIDCVDVSSTRIIMGKWDGATANCLPK